MLHLLRQQNEFEIAGLLTTLNREFERVAMHAVRRELLQAQADAAGLPLWTVPLPWPCSNEDYECAMREVCARAVAAGVQAVAFGDLFLEDIRAYREKQMQGSGLEPLFPLWLKPTPELAQHMVRGGLKAKLTCVDPNKLAPSFAGREFEDVLRDLPAGIDPCGERGEFHTFAYAGPMFAREIPVKIGEVVERDGFVFADLQSASC